MVALVHLAGSLEDFGFDILGSPSLVSSSSTQLLIDPSTRPARQEFHAWFLLDGQGQFQSDHHASLALSAHQILWLKHLPNHPPRIVWSVRPAPCLLVIRFRLDPLLHLIDPSSSKLLLPELRPQLARDNQPAHPVVQPMTGTDREFALAFRHPPVPSACVNLWCRGRVMEYLARRVFQPATADAQSQPSNLLPKVKSRLLTRLDQPLDLDLLARELSMSRSHLSRKFSRETGFTLRHYLQTLRMTEAARLITRQRIPVSSAAVEVGYQSLGHFSAAFKEHHGCLPSEWAARHQLPRG